MCLLHVATYASENLINIKSVNCTTTKLWELSVKKWQIVMKDKITEKELNRNESSNDIKELKKD